MAKSKKNNSFLHPIDTVTQWYAEAQNIPAQLRKSLESEKDAALRHIKKLGEHLKKAKDQRSKAKAHQVHANQRLQEHPTEAARALVRKCKAKYSTVHNRVEKIAGDIKAAKSQLSHAKLKQKYFHALEKAFAAVTKIFTHKHSKSHTKKHKK